MDGEKEERSDLVTDRIEKDRKNSKEIKTKQIPRDKWKGESINYKEINPRNLDMVCQATNYTYFHLKWIKFSYVLYVR